MTALAHSTARKAEHLRIAAGPGVQHSAGSGLDAVQLGHRALPGRDLDAVDPTTDLLGSARLAAPLVVSAMTGGTPEAEAVNREVAQRFADWGVPTAVAARQGRASEAVAVLVRQLRIATWATGAVRSADLGPEHVR